MYSWRQGFNSEAFLKDMVEATIVFPSGSASSLQSVSHILPRGRLLESQAQRENEAKRFSVL